MTWINREAEQELRKALEKAVPSRASLLALLDSMHVIDAGDDEAEAALERMGDYARTGWYTTHGNTDLANQEETGKAMNADLATIRARLRAARASHTPEEIEAAWEAWSCIDRRFHKRDAECIADPCHLHGWLDTIARVLPPRPEPTAKTKETKG